MCEVNCFYTAPKPAASKAVFSGAILSFPQLQIYSCLLRSLGHSLPFCAAQHRNEEASAQLCFSFMFNFISPHKSDAKKWDSTHDSCCCVEDRKEARKTWHDSKGVRIALPWPPAGLSSYSTPCSRAPEHSQEHPGEKTQDSCSRLTLSGFSRARKCNKIKVITVGKTKF